MFKENNIGKSESDIKDLLKILVDMIVKDHLLEEVQEVGRSRSGDRNLEVVIEIEVLEPGQKFKKWW